MTLEEKIEEVKRKLEEKRKNEVKDTMEYWRNLTKRFETPDDVPLIPNFNPDRVPNAGELMQEVQNKMIELGAIPKDKLIVGHTYLGECRNATKAIWKENGKFEYMRTKFGYTYPEEINHFQDDDGYDLFVPIKDITEE